MRAGELSKMAGGLNHVFGISYPMPLFVFASFIAMYGEV